MGSNLPADVRKLINDAVRVRREQFIATRYPYTYSADFLRAHRDIVPEGIGRRLGVIDSRADASEAKHLWAEKLGVHEYILACALADAYLRENNVAGGPPRYECGWFYEDTQCPL